MEVSVTQSQRLPLLVAATATVIVAASLILATWNSVRQQRELVERHMLLSAGIVLRATQANLLGSLRRMGPMGPMEQRGHGRQFGGGFRAGELLSDLTEDSDVRFLALLDPEGRMVSTSAERTGYQLPSEALVVLRAQGRWHELTESGNGRVLLMAVRAHPAMSRLCQPRPGQAEQPALPDRPNSPDAPGQPGQPRHPGMAGRPGQTDQMAQMEQMGRSGWDCPPGEGPRPVGYLLMALGVEEYLAHYLEFRRTAMYQTGFILAAAAGFLAFFTYYLRRREQSRAYQALQRFHARLLDDMPDGLLSVDGQGVVRAANPAAHAILDREPGALVGARLDSLPLARVAGEEREGEAWAEYELGGKRLEVLRREVGGAGEGPGSEDPGARLVLVRDRTRVKALEKRLSEAEKLAAVGRLAAGVAHEIRNPLSALRGFAQLFLKKFQGVAPEEEYARTMVSEADRLNKVITDMLFLARPRSLEPRSVDIAGLFKDLRRLLAAEAREASAELRFEAEAPMAHADPDGLKQVLLNLIMNSLAALPESGGHVSVEARPAEGGVLLSVADDGRGFSPEARERALEPFFTTRSKGTGLGLAIAHKLVQDHGGRLDIESVEGHGAVVRVFLPDAPDAPQAA